MESKSYYPANVDTQQYIIQYNFIKIKKMVKGLMIESYIEDGNQKDTDRCYGKSITDACIGWEKTNRLVRELAELWEM